MYMVVRAWTWIMFFFFSSRRRHTRYWRDWSSDVCSSDLVVEHQSRNRWVVGWIPARGVWFFQYLLFYYFLLDTSEFLLLTMNQLNNLVVIIVICSVRRWHSDPLYSQAVLVITDGLQDYNELDEVRTQSELIRKKGYPIKTISFITKRWATHQQVCKLVYSLFKG